MSDPFFNDGKGNDVIKQMPMLFNPLMLNTPDKEYSEYSDKEYPYPC